MNSTKIETLKIRDRMIPVYGDPNAEAVLLFLKQEGDAQEDLEAVLTYLDESGHGEALLSCAVPVRDWNRELSPWEAPPVFGNEGFGDGAQVFLETVLEAADALVTWKERKLILAGYSLAGLFALWAAGRTDRFWGITAASPSVWFPDFDRYMQENPCRAEHVYLSLGDREARTRNPVMARVADRIREEEARLKGQGIDCILEWNKGNHFQEPMKRTAKGVLWLLERNRQDAVL